MLNMRSTIPRPPLLRITLIQLLIAVLSSLVVLSKGSVASYSLIAGCLIHIIGTAYFAMQAYRHQGASRSRAMVQKMYQGETGKILLSAALFAAVFVTVKPLNIVFVFAGYILMVVVHTVLFVKMTRK